jgi:hypothetical protein
MPADLPDVLHTAADSGPAASPDLYDQLVRRRRRSRQLRTTIAVTCAVALAGAVALTADLLRDDPQRLIPADDPAAPEQPYDGPMVVPTSPNSPNVLLRSGAAGKALECSTSPYLGGSEADPVFGVKPSAQEAVQGYLRWEPFPVPHDGYRIERHDGDRVLLSYDVDRRSKVTFVVRDGVEWSDSRGWAVETWATCDPSELPEQETARLGLQVWQDTDGNRVPVTTISSSQGAAHCGWQGITFLSLGSPPKATFLRDTRGQLAGHLATTYAEGVALPSDAKDSGYRLAGRELWLDPDGTAAYLVQPGDRADTERWPATTDLVACA